MIDISGENVVLVGALLLFVAVMAGKVAYRFGAPALLLFLGVGMLFGLNFISFRSVEMTQFVGMIALCIILFTGGMDTSFQEIKPIIGPGVVLATVGVVMTAMVLAGFVWLVAPWLDLEISFALALLLAAPLAKLFVGYDEGLYTLTCHAFRLFSFAFLFAGFNIFASSFFTALGNGLISAAISFLRTLVFQTASVLILPLIFDVDGIWYAITVAEVFATLISVIFLFAKRKKYHYMECSPHGKK